MSAKATILKLHPLLIILWNTLLRRKLWVHIPPHLGWILTVTISYRNKEKVIHFHKNGRKEMVDPYVDGERHGIAKYWEENGKLKTMYKTIDGDMKDKWSNGKWVWGKKTRPIESINPPMQAVEK